jgi:hypothetical protein
MKQYKSNMDSKDAVFENRKHDLIEKSKKSTTTNVEVESVAKELEGMDPWTASKNNNL